MNSVRPSSHDRRLTIAKSLMRFVGTLGGLLGLVLIGIGSSMLYRASTEPSAVMILLTAFLLTLAVYFSYVAWLVWCRFSPLAVRHICGMLAVYVLGPVTNLFDPTHASPWTAFASLGCLVAVYVAYDVGSIRLSRWLFPEPEPGVQS